MKIIGLTGGIGSGKSTMLEWFQSKNIPCFESDNVGKILLEDDLKQEVLDTFVPELYADGRLDRKRLAALVFNDTNALEKLNAIVHPAVAKAFEKFKEKNKEAPWVVKETAILFETGIYENCDFIILVCAPMEDRISRVMKRDGVSRTSVLERIKKQWDDSKKRPLADCIIENDRIDSALKQLELVFSKLLDPKKD